MDNRILLSATILGGRCGGLLWSFELQKLHAPANNKVPIFIRANRLSDMNCVKLWFKEKTCISV